MKKLIGKTLLIILLVGLVFGAGVALGAFANANNALPPSDPVDSGAYINDLVPNWVSLITQFGALLVLVIVMLLLVYKPVKNIMNKRNEHIENNIKEAEENNAIAKENNLKSQENVISSQKEAANIVATAQNQALNERAQIVNETGVIVAKMKLDAEADIERAKEDAKEEIRKEIIEVALGASSEILKREINEEDDAKFANQFIEEVSK